MKVGRQWIVPIVCLMHFSDFDGTVDQVELRGSMIVIVLDLGDTHMNDEFTWIVIRSVIIIMNGTESQNLTVELSIGRYRWFPHEIRENLI